MKQRRQTGRYETTTVAGEEVPAFVPYPLPPAGPVLRLDKSLTAKLEEATRRLSQLELAGAMVPSLDWFIYAFVRKEAVTSSQIEGTQSTLMDLLTFEASGQAERVDKADVQEVCNYLDALVYARKQLNSKKGLPLSVRLLNETHRRLMKGVRGEAKQPGEIRRSQNWIGGVRPGLATFVPPPVSALAPALTALEKYIHSKDSLPTLIRAGLIHVQFETIHPYLDGNGRIGRLLIMLLLESWGLLSAPLLYLSLYFKQHREEYYQRLSAVRTDGDWEGWTAFFLEGVVTIATEAIALARELFSLVSKDRTQLLAAADVTVVAARLFEILPLHPIITMPGVVKLLQTTKPTASKAIGVLQKHDILVEQSGRKRDRTFAYKAYLDCLKTGTEKTVAT